MVSSAEYHNLKQTLQGPIFTPSDPGYNEYRGVWNLDVDRRPAAVVRCANEDDVRKAVRFAVDAGVEDVAVRGGGHSYPGLSTCDDGLVIDLGLMRGGRIGQDNRVFLQGGALLQDMDALTTKIGTAVPAGVEATTGVAGLTLGGGIGNLQRRFGLTCDNLRAVRIVTAEGQVVVADDESDPELMWGLRGGGGNFGIVTEFEFQSHPVDPYSAISIILPVNKMRAFATFFDDWVGGLPKEMASCLINPLLPPNLAQTLRGVGASPRPTRFEGEGEYFAVNALWTGRPDELSTVMKPLDDWNPIANVAREITHAELQSTLPEMSAPQKRYVRGGYLDAVGGGVLLDCLDVADETAPPLFSFVFSAFGGAVAEVGEMDSAFCGRSAGYLYAIEASWNETSERESTINWVRAAYDAIEKYATGGGYTNTVTDEGASGGSQGTRGIPPGVARVKEVFGQEKFARLQRLKSQWDPTNVFHLNVNVPPAEIDERKTET